jgi:predicted nucleic acid-binding Zn ribbon protein
MAPQNLGRRIGCCRPGDSMIQVVDRTERAARRAPFRPVAEWRAGGSRPFDHAIRPDGHLVRLETDGRGGLVEIDLGLANGNAPPFIKSTWREREAALLLPESRGPRACEVCGQPVPEAAPPTQRTCGQACGIRYNVRVRAEREAAATS